MRSYITCALMTLLSCSSFAYSGSYMEVAAPQSGASCVVVTALGYTTSLNTKDYGYDVQKDIKIFDGVSYQKMGIAIFDNKDQTIDFNFSTDKTADTHLYSVKVPKAYPSPFNPNDSSKTMATEIFENQLFKLYCVAK